MLNLLLLNVMALAMIGGTLLVIVHPVSPVAMAVVLLFLALVNLIGLVCAWRWVWWKAYVQHSHESIAIAKAKALR